MNQRKRLISQLENLDHQFVTQQRRVAKHAHRLSIWYREYRQPLWLGAFSITAGLTYLNYQLDQPVWKNRRWVQRTRLSVLWLLNFFVFNPRMLRKLLRVIRQEQLVAHV